MLERSPLSLGTDLRRRVGAAVVDGFFRGVSAAGRLHPRARPERHDLEVLRDVPYRPSGLAEHRLDIYRPRAGRGEGPLPVVLYVHGGGFRILSKDTHWIMGLAFARRGYLVFNISYRLAPRAPFPAAIEDSCEALQWVARNAARYGGDPSRLVLAGESAGANLVTSLALATSYRRPEPWAARLFDAEIRPSAVIPACGLLQVTEPERFRRRWPKLSPFIYDRLFEVSRAYLGDDLVHRPGAHDLADPLVFFERGERPERALPPFFAPCGTSDPLIDDTQRLKRALDGLGAECVAEYYPGEPHAFHAFVFKENARRCWGHTYAFLDEHLGSAAHAEEE
ncbi:MAG: alpha/beta hydrolase [Sorangiineae bacterium]|nr:alpha/beta hydrolase [Polyangiaceae bacterium]MEB2323342.1 alpha/beta hydrolase [Sorangiineae bacterium]